jgi:hypothetical protein
MIMALHLPNVICEEAARMFASLAMSEGAKSGVMAM